MQADPRRFIVILLSLFVLFALVATSAVARPAVGTADNPILLSVVDDIDVDAVEEMAIALEIATGLYFEVESIEYGQPGIEWLCADHPDRGLRIMPATEYVMAKDGCDAKATMALRRWGVDASNGQFLVPHGSGLSSLSDLDGLDWYYSDEGSTVAYMAPLYMLDRAGVEGYTPFPIGSHFDAVEAVYANAIDPGNPDPVFASVFVDARWNFDRNYEYEPFDPSVFDVVEVLEVTPDIPFEVAAFGPQFPGNLRQQIERLMDGFANEAHPAHWVWGNSFAIAYSSDGWISVNWADFQFLKRVMTYNGYTF